MTTAPLINKYRPASFNELIGHDATVDALIRAMDADTRPHAYLFTGPAGTGKTSSARLVAKHLQCDGDIIEIDAASHNGIDDMRALVDLGTHRSLSGAGRRAFIIDEVHGLSKPAWQAILKVLEEPPEHLFLMLCTTELNKIPETIKSRCYHVAYRALRPDDVAVLLETIAEAEGWQVQNDVMTAVVQAAGGSPRKAISTLQQVWDAGSREEAGRIIALGDSSEPLIELCQALLKGGFKWTALQKIIARIGDDEYEEGLNGAARYVAAAMMRSDTEGRAKIAWRILEAITFPTTTYDRKVHFLAAIGRLCFED